jgi:polysaccharide pyruvyl transferase WcaK-like protein
VLTSSQPVDLDEHFIRDMLMANRRSDGMRMSASSDTPSTSRANGSGLRVVVQNGEHWMLNKGDLAMLDVTIRRLRARWADARLGVLTSAPLLLSAFQPEAEPILPTGRGAWPRTGTIGRLAAAAGPGLCGPVTVGWLNAQHRPRHLGRRARNALDARLQKKGGRSKAVRASRDVPFAVRDASLVLAMGGGYLADVDPGQTHRTLDLLEYAVGAGIPTAMVGQGLGPIDDDVLLARAERILPMVDLIALREGRRGPKLLADLGVLEDHTMVTGDDAIELATGARRDVLGTDLGICLRIADYSPVADQTRAAVRSAMHDTARHFGAALVPLIISEFKSEDRRSTLPLVAGFPDVVPPLPRYVGPRGVADRVSRCRVLVTGAYHLAVFALSQGIPVVGLTASRYYDDKLLGLAEMFGCGLTVVRLDEPGLAKHLSTAIRTAWDEAERLREPLRSKADEQIHSSRRAFEQVFELVEAAERNRRH